MSVDLFQEPYATSPLTKHWHFFFFTLFLFQFPINFSYRYSMNIFEKSGANQSLGSMLQSIVDDGITSNLIRQWAHLDASTKWRRPPPLPHLFTLQFLAQFAYRQTFIALLSISYWRPLNWKMLTLTTQILTKKLIFLIFSSKNW